MRWRWPIATPPNDGAVQRECSRSRDRMGIRVLYAIARFSNRPAAEAQAQVRAFQGHPFALVLHKGAMQQLDGALPAVYVGCSEDNILFNFPQNSDKQTRRIYVSWISQRIMDIIRGQKGPTVVQLHRGL